MKTNFLQVHSQTSLFSFLEWPLWWNSPLLIILHVSPDGLVTGIFCRAGNHALCGRRMSHEPKRILALHSSGPGRLPSFTELRLLSLLSYLLLLLLLLISHPRLFLASLLKTVIFRDPATPSASLFSRTAYMRTGASSCS
jgi:hypothetical protein